MFSQSKRKKKFGEDWMDWAYLCSHLLIGGVLLNVAREIVTYNTVLGIIASFVFIIAFFITLVYKDAKDFENQTLKDTLSRLREEEVTDLEVEKFLADAEKKIVEKLLKEDEPPK